MASFNWVASTRTLLSISLLKSRASLFTSGAGAPNADPIHPDVWDAMALPATSDIVVATDGGVYRRTAGKWSSQNDNLPLAEQYLASAGLA